MVKMFHFKLYVKNSEGKGNGVFTKEFIPKGECIEVSPFLVIDKKIVSNGIGTKNNLNQHLYKHKEHYHIVLGYGSLYNHNDEPNINFIIDIDRGIYEYYSIKDINEDEEIFLNYGIKKNEWV